MRLNPLPDTYATRTGVEIIGDIEKLAAALTGEGERYALCYLEYITGQGKRPMIPASIGPEVATVLKAIAKAAAEAEMTREGVRRQVAQAAQQAAA